MKTIVPDTQTIAAAVFIAEPAVSSCRRNVPDASKMKRQLGVKFAHVA